MIRRFAANNSHLFGQCRILHQRSQAESICFDSGFCRHTAYLFIHLFAKSFQLLFPTDLEHCLIKRRICPLYKLLPCMRNRIYFHRFIFQIVLY